MSVNESHASVEGGATAEAAFTGFDVTWVVDPSVSYAALFCVVVSCILTFREVRSHIARYDYPRIQVYVLRILLMVPIYGVFSISSVFVPNMRFFLVTIRDTYESFVLYMFFSLLIAYCGGEGQLIRALHAKRYKGVHPVPMCYLPLYPLDTAFYLRCKRWVLQYALFKPIGSFLAMIFYPFGLYNENNFNANNLYTYVCIISNLSISWSLYYLVLFDMEVEKELRYCKPTMKFVCIKSIIFFSFWQSVALSMMIAWGLVYTGEDAEQQEYVSACAQNLLMCFELLPVAVMHHFAFSRDKLDDEMSAEPVFNTDAKKATSMAKNFDEALSLEDVIEDTISTIFFRRGKLVDKENEDVEENGAGGGGQGGGQDGGGGKDAEDVVTLDMITHAREPTVEQLVKYAIAHERGARADGLLHFDEESDTEQKNFDCDNRDTDVITRRSREDEGNVVRVAAMKNATGPSNFCVVCGRFDREMVKRKSGFKCKDCVGVKGNTLLRDKQKEKHAEDNDGSCAVCGRSDRPMVRRGQVLKCTGCL